MGSLHPTTDGDCFVTFSTNMDIVQFETSKTVLGHDCLTKRRWKLGRIIRDDKHSDLGRASADYSLARARSRSIYGRFCIRRVMPSRGAQIEMQHPLPIICDSLLDEPKQKPEQESICKFT